MQTINDFDDYEILGMSNGYKYERWGNIYLKRPDPEIIWPGDVQSLRVDAEYTRSNTGGGDWKIKRNIPSSWKVNYKDLVFNLKLMGFKHTGLFPEQAYNWDLIRKKIKDSKKKVKVLNLFAYTGAASIAALYCSPNRLYSPDRGHITATTTVALSVLSVPEVAVVLLLPVEDSPPHPAIESAINPDSAIDTIFFIFSSSVVIGKM